MLLKRNMRFYVDPIQSRGLGYMLMQTNSSIAVGFFPDMNEATWVAQKLNSGRRLCVAMNNLLDHDGMVGGMTNGLVDDALEALTEYMSDDPYQPL